METKANYIAVGSFVFLFLVATVVFALWVSRVDFTEDKHLYAIYFKGAVTGLRVNEQVRFHGIPVGRVRKISIDPQTVEKVKVIVSIEEPYLIREDTVASVEAQGLTGYTFIQLEGSSQQAPLLKAKPSEAYPIIQSRRSNMEALLKGVPDILKQVKGLVTRFNTFFDQKNHDHLNKIMTHMAHLSEQLTQGPYSLHQTLKTLKEAMTTVNKQVQQVGTDLTGTLAELKKASIAFDQTTREVQKMIHENQDSVKDFTHSGFSELKNFLSEARETVNHLNRVMGDLEQNPGNLFQKTSQEGYQVEEGN